MLTQPAFSTAKQSLCCNIYQNPGDFLIGILSGNTTSGYLTQARLLAMSQVIRFKLNISPENYLKFYQGQARNVEAKAEDGRKILFPANTLQRFLTHTGISGRFEISFDENHKFVGLEKIS